MKSNAQLKWYTGHVTDFEFAARMEKSQGHGGDFRCVLYSVFDGKSTDHHVGVTDRLHLNTTHSVNRSVS